MLVIIRVESFTSPYATWFRILFLPSRCRLYKITDELLEKLDILREERTKDLSGNRPNRLFPSCFEPHCQSEAKCKVFITKISFHSNANKTSVAFIMRFTTTRKLPIRIISPESDK